MKLGVKIKRLSEDAVIPKYAHKNDAGVDLVASQDVIIEPGETKLVPTGIAVSIPPGFEGQVRPRSGITLRTKLRIQLGTIDSGYNGEIGVICDNIGKELVGANLSENTYVIRKGDRIAQLVFAPIEQAHFYEVDTLDDTQRGVGGFGSTGVKEDE
ncbi:dUTP diphosphatase [Neobacillus mesonae]|uniref:dUTP diphosphatase n=1 Tax=Neobacillus mesonae TaxID=1193713 RepID=A0A3Q9QQV6_9BACI|nr:dUTP diphosphatase [Neobacillus mesonae]AZU61043.1 deoxyuridine 5'-triphosphate nucleotidohydrolase [Neobacillus mesonae]